MFQPFKKFVYRLPAFSVNRLMKIFDAEEELSGWLVDERIGETVYVGSPDLYKELQKLINGEIKEGDKKRKIKTSLVKYLSRMSTRCTPFGLFATCSVGKIDDITQFEITDEMGRCTRIDMYYLCALAQFLGYLPDIRREVRYYSNNTLYKVGNCMRYIEYKYLNKRCMHFLCSTKFHTPHFAPEPKNGLYLKYVGFIIFSFFCSDNCILICISLIVGFNNVH